MASRIERESRRSAVGVAKRMKGVKTRTACPRIRIVSGGKIEGVPPMRVAPRPIVSDLAVLRLPRSQSHPVLKQHQSGCPSITRPVTQRKVRRQPDPKAVAAVWNEIGQLHQRRAFIGVGKCRQSGKRFREGLAWIDWI